MNENEEIVTSSNNNPTPAPKVEKEKKPTFFQKLKAKIDKLFESDSLTFIGKIFMLGLYVCALTGGSIVGVSVLKTIVNLALQVFNIRYADGIFTAACVLLWLLFIIALLVVIILAIIEAFVTAEGENSIMESKE